MERARIHVYMRGTTYLYLCLCIERYDDDLSKDSSVGLFCRFVGLFCGVFLVGLFCGFFLVGLFCVALL